MKSPEQTIETFGYSAHHSETVTYLQYLPKGYEPTGEKKWPLILFLHGSGERGNNIWRVATHGPPRHVTSGLDMPFIVVSPQCPEGRVWSSEPLLGLLDAVLKKVHADPKRVYLTGLSMGGYGSWDLGLAHPGRFAAVAPICGGGDFLRPLLASREKPEAFKSLAIWAFHGAKDNVVPLSESERMVAFTKQAGVKEVKLTVYPEANHDSWTATYENPELYKWFLEHSR